MLTSPYRQLRDDNEWGSTCRPSAAWQSSIFISNILRPIALRPCLSTGLPFRDQFCKVLFVKGFSFSILFSPLLITYLL
jgi:hypothetical protein